jgi:hypothetical protein
LHDRNEYEGTGIGLSHCEKNSSLHGGLFGAESKFGEGTVLILQFEKSIRMRKKYCILLVDDDEMVNCLNIRISKGWNSRRN